MRQHMYAVRVEHASGRVTDCGLYATLDEAIAVASAQGATVRRTGRITGIPHSVSGTNNLTVWIDVARPLGD